MAQRTSRDPFERWADMAGDLDPDRCWIWTGKPDRNGYGSFRSGTSGESVMAHRWGYEYLVERVARELHLDHLCRVRNCVNPDHLEPVTPAENVARIPILRGGHPPRSHCGRGHAMTPTNVGGNGAGKRRCRTCHADNERERARRKKAA